MTKRNRTKPGGFLKAIIASPARVGAVCPTSPNVAKEMARPVTKSSQVVVELGAGNGAVTREILKRLSPQATFIIFELDPNLRQLLQEQVPVWWSQAHPRKTMPKIQLYADARQLKRRMGRKKADVVICAVPFTTVGEQTTSKILDEVEQVLSKDGVFVAIQYTKAMWPRFKKKFKARSSDLLMNMPPARVFRCRRRE